MQETPYKIPMNYCFAYRYDRVFEMRLLLYNYNNYYCIQCNPGKANQSFRKIINSGEKITFAGTSTSKLNNTEISLKYN